MRITADPCKIWLRKERGQKFSFFLLWERSHMTSAAEGEGVSKC